MGSAVITFARPVIIFATKLAIYLRRVLVLALSLSLNTEEVWGKAEGNGATLLFYTGGRRPGLSNCTMFC